MLLQQHMRSGRDLSSRPGIFALLRSQNLISTIPAVSSDRKWKRWLAAQQCCNLEEIRVNLARLLAALISSLGLELLFAWVKWHQSRISPRRALLLQWPGDWSLSCPMVPWGRPTGSFDSRISLKLSLEALEAMPEACWCSSCGWHTPAHMLTLPSQRLSEQSPRSRGSQLIPFPWDKWLEGNTTRVSQCLPVSTPRNTFQLFKQP